MPNHRKPQVGDEYKELATGQSSRWNGKTWVTTAHDRVLNETSGEVKPGVLAAFELKDCNIYEWHPTPDGSGKPTQVHLVANYYGVPQPFVWRFKGPETIGQIILALSRHRKSVWPDAPDWTTKSD